MALITSSIAVRDRGAAVDRYTLVVDRSCASGMINTELTFVGGISLSVNFAAAR